jgi:hypothetical protein
MKQPLTTTQIWLIVFSIALVIFVICTQMKQVQETTHAAPPYMFEGHSEIKDTVK